MLRLVNKKGIGTFRKAEEMFTKNCHYLKKGETRQFI